MKKYFYILITIILAINTANSFGMNKNKKEAIDGIIIGIESPKLEFEEKKVQPSKTEKSKKYKQKLKKHTEKITDCCSDTKDCCCDALNNCGSCCFVTMCCPILPCVFLICLKKFADLQR
ncbi:hypothetical protein ACFLYU_02700 [Candidatus Dependentiae bacterium]